MNLELFTNQALAQRSFESFETLLGLPLPEEFVRSFNESPEPDLALRNTERWLASTTNPNLHLTQLVSHPNLSKWLVMILGSSQPLADCLIQNPELASVVLDPVELARKPTAELVLTEGRQLVSHSTSYSHTLDRIRYLKQRWTLPIVINDLSRSWSEPDVWLAISDLADGLIQLTVEAVWNHFSAEQRLEGDCPLMVIGFGKLGGRELNYSSDIDLAYVCPDGMSEELDRQLTKFCELLGRALSDRMGRGSVYRIDLRLRPYGNAGPLLPSMRAFEHYYRLYAEQWEVQALLRTRPIVGPPELRVRWNEMRSERCFRPHLSEPELDAMLSMKTRIEERADESDLKRGAGGIRDVEFLVQVLQLLHGHNIPEVQAESTLQTLNELDRNALLDHAVVASLEDGYIFLRQLEHRCQLVGDQQTHNIPDSLEAKNRLAVLMGFGTWTELDRQLEFHRRTIQTLYKATLRPEQGLDTSRDLVAERSGSLAASTLQWFDSLPESDAFYESLTENRDSLDRVRLIARDAPALVLEFKRHVALTELLISGEIEEEFEPSSGIASLALDASPKQVAHLFVRNRTRILAQWVLLPETEVGSHLANLVDALIVHCTKRLLIQFDLIALGSYGLGELTLDSDADLLFLVSHSEKQVEAESQAQQLLALLSQLKRMGAPIGVDLRLRPDGGKGMLVRSHDALLAYDLEGMAMWERFALGSSRLIRGESASLELIQRLAYAQPVTPERLRELLEMKKRVETERVPPQHTRRNVKLGFGGLTDIEWLVHLYEMRFPTATKAGTLLSMPDRIRELGRAHLLNAVEVEQLLFARSHLLEIRMRLGLQGMEKDVLPENPDKLNRLAEGMKCANGNELLAVHERVIESVRAIYVEGLGRLKA